MNLIPLSVVPTAPALPARRRRHVASGFTVIELVVTMTVAAILVAVGVPAMSSFIQNGRSSNEAASMVLMLTFARNEALKRDVATGVTVCPSADGQTCDPAGNWAERWIVPDPVTPANPPLQVGLALSSSNTIGEATGQTKVVFLPSGAASVPVAFHVCDSRGAAYAREFEVSLSGRILASPTVGKTVAGAAVTCP